MRIVGTTVVFFCIILASAKLTSAKAWRGITPLKSTRADVERLLGPALQEHEHSDLYELKDEVVEIEYASFPCEHKPPPGWPETSPGWNVPKDTVVAISVRPRNRVTLASLDIDLSSFKKLQVGDDTPDIHVYSNEAEGFSLEVYEYKGAEKPLVSAFIYFHTSAEETLRCKG